MTFGGQFILYRWDEFYASSKELFQILEIRSVGRDICPIAVLYFAVKRSFFNIKKFCWSKRVPNTTWCWVTLRHRSRDHKTRSGWFPIGGPLTPTLYLGRFQRYWAWNILGHDLDPLWSVVTWRHGSRDHKTRTGLFPIGGQLTPISLSHRYWDSITGCAVAQALC